MISDQVDYDKMVELYAPIYETLKPQPPWFYTDKYPIDPSNPQIALLGEAPSKDECINGRLGESSSGLLLDVALNFANINKDICHITNVFPFARPKKKQWKVSEADYVASHVRERLKRFPIVVAMGKMAVRIYDIKPGNINDQSGDVLDFIHPDGHKQKIVYSVAANYAVKGYIEPSADSSSFWYLVLALKNTLGLLQNENIFEGSDNHKASLIIDKNAMKDYIHAIPKGEMSTVDFEATSTNPYLSSLPLCVGMSHDGIKSMTMAFHPWYPQSNITFNDYLSVITEADQFHIVMHNLLYDYSLMTRFGYKGRPPAIDSMYLAHIGYEFLPKSLKFLSSFFAKIRPYSFSFNKIKPFIEGAQTYEDTEYWLIQLLHYCGLDAISTRLLINALPKVAGSEWSRIEKTYFDYIQNLLLALHGTQRDGLILNQKVLTSVRNDLTKTINDSERNCKILLPGVNNIRSNKQLSKAFEPIVKPHSKLYKKNKTGISLTADILQELSDMGIKAAEELLTFRKASKLSSTYVESYPQYLDANGLIHTQFGLAKTSRLKSSDPALQTLPRKSSVLTLFTSDFDFPPYDHIFIKADYSAAEARLLAYYCGIEKLLDPTIDVHVLSATMFFGVSVDEVTPDMRQKTKNLTFGTIYGASAARVALLVFGVVTDETKLKAQALLDTFLIEKFPEIKQFMVNREADISTQGFIEMSITRLRRHFPVECFAKQLIMADSTCSDARARFGRMIYAKAIREGYNFQPQSGVAYLTNKALIDLRNNYKDTSWITEKPSVNLQFHDALITRSHKDDFFKALNIMKDTMLQPIMGPVIPIDMQIGWNLKDCIEIVAANESVNSLNWEEVQTKIKNTNNPMFNGIFEFVQHSIAKAKDEK